MKEIRPIVSRWLGSGRFVERLMDASAGLLSVASHFPPHQRSIADLFGDEGLELSADQTESLGVESVHVCDTETTSSLALAAASEAIRLADLHPSDIHVIIDFSVLPQDYLVPSWSMGNKLQHELGATKAFTVGFSGAGSTSFHVALSAGLSFIQSDGRISTVLLVGAERAIPANRVLNPNYPITVLGDGASAAVLQRAASRNVVVDTELISHGSLHDVCCIKGGGIAHPDRVDWYRMRIDEEKYGTTDNMKVLSHLTEKLLERAGLTRSDVSHFVYPNLSLDDQNEFVRAFKLREDQILPTSGRRYGHVQATDLLVNFRDARDSGLVKKGNYVLMISHGMGHVFGVALIQG